MFLPFFTWSLNAYIYIYVGVYLYIYYENILKNHYDNSIWIHLAY